MPLLCRGISRLFYLTNLYKKYADEFSTKIELEVDLASTTYLHQHSKYTLTPSLQWKHLHNPYNRHKCTLAKSFIPQRTVGDRETNNNLSKHIHKHPLSYKCQEGYPFYIEIITAVESNTTIECYKTTQNRQNHHNNER